MMSNTLRKRLIALHSANLPEPILAWLDRHFDGADDATIEATLTPDFIVWAVRFALADKFRAGSASASGAPPKGDKRGN